MRNFKVTVNGRMYEVTVEEAGSTGAPVQTAEQIQLQPEAMPAAVPTPAKLKTPGTIAAGDIPINAPLAGAILSVKVKPGDKVKYGQALLTLEALKMENEIVAPEAGVVKDIFAEQGATVNVGDVLLTLGSE